MDPISNFGSLPLAVASEEKAPFVSVWGLMIYLAITLFVFFGLAAYAKKGLGERVFRNPILRLGEHLYLFVENMCLGIIGHHGRRYVPMIMSFWLVIFFGNLFALFLPFSPTADLSFNLALALLAVGWVQLEGIRSHGLLGHLRHFAGPRLGIWLIPITALIFVVEIISEIMKNLSLSLRLYGNIFGGHEAVGAIDRLGENLIGPFGIPFGEFLMPIKLLTVVVQALIFTILTTVYVSLVTHHEEDHPEESHVEADLAISAEHLSPA